MDLYIPDTVTESATKESYWCLYFYLVSGHPAKPPVPNDAPSAGSPAGDSASLSLPPQRLCNWLTLSWAS